MLEGVVCADPPAAGVLDRPSREFAQLMRPILGDGLDHVMAGARGGVVAQNGHNAGQQPLPRGRGQCTLDLRFNEGQRAFFKASLPLEQNQHGGHQGRCFVGGNVSLLVGLRAVDIGSASRPSILRPILRHRGLSGRANRP